MTDDAEIDADIDIGPGVCDRVGVDVEETPGPGVWDLG